MTRKLEKIKINSMQCINPKTLMSCNHLWVGTMFGTNFLPYYCAIKCQEVLIPIGIEKCKHFQAVDTSNWIIRETQREK